MNGLILASRAGLQALLEMLPATIPDGRACPEHLRNAAHAAIFSILTVSQFFPCPHLGSEVELTDERRQHIVQSHPGTLPDYAEQLAQTLAEPDLVRPSQRDERALRFSKWFDDIRTGRYMVVVTISDSDPTRHWIVTTYTARRLAGGS